MKTMYNTNINRITTISQFPETSIHQSMTALRALKLKIFKAMLKSKLHKISCRIVFIDINGLREIEAQICATCEKSIFLKKGICIPIKRILDVII